MLVLAFVVRSAAPVEVTDGAAPLGAALVLSALRAVSAATFAFAAAAEFDPAAAALVPETLVPVIAGRQRQTLFL